LFGCVVVFFWGRGPSGGTTPPLLKNNKKHLFYGNAVENKLGKKRLITLCGSPAPYGKVQTSGS
jgi:hypothetical protein